MDDLTGGDFGLMKITLLIFYIDDRVVKVGSGLSTLGIS
jgi:hypothetical protein